MSNEKLNTDNNLGQLGYQLSYLSKEDLVRELLKASIEGNCNLMAYLLNNNDFQLSINEGLTNKKNALMWACSKNHLNIVKYLLTSPALKENANINQQDNNESTALLYACNRGHLEIVKYLLTSAELKEHADIYHEDSTGWNSLVCSSMFGDINVSQFLIIDMNMKVSDKSFKILNGDNRLKKVCVEVLKIIESRNLYTHLNNNINNDILNNKKIKI